MSSEYVRLSYPEKLFGEKNLLYTELELLTSTKRITTYRKLRKKELLLKIAVKTKIKEVLLAMKELDKMLPTAHLPRKKKVEEKKKMDKEIQEEMKETGIEAELQAIRDKLASLRG